jgi:hypothetical protein
VACLQLVSLRKINVEVKMRLSRFLSFTSSFGVAAALLVFFSSQGFAQVDRAGLSGTVTDPVGKAIPGIRVMASMPEAGLVRETVTSRTGSYEVPELPIGSYTVTFAGNGFATLTFNRVIQTVGRTRTLNATLHVAGATQQINVSSVTSQLDETNDALGARTESKQVEDLPLNGRNWSTLTALVPGAVDTGGSNQRSIRFAGRGLDDNNFTYDGIDATNIVNQAQQSFVRLAIPTDAIQEFHIDTMLFTAENGSTPGGQVDVASKTGTNTLHGGLFEFLRNDIFDARDPILPTRLPFRLNQFGGDLGGRLVHDRSFFFFNCEGLRQSYGQPLSGFVPNPAFAAQVVAADPALAPVVAAYPTTGLTPYATNIDQFTGSGRQLDHEDSAMLRLDQHFSLADTAYLRFSFDAATSDVPSDSLNDRQLTTSRPVNGELEELHIFSPRLVNESKFGFNRSTVFTTNQGLAGLPYSIAVSGLTTLANNELTAGVGNSFSYIDNLTMVRGAHTFKFGVEVRRIQLDQGNTANGTVTYSSLASFLADAVSSATYNDSLPLNGLRKTDVYSFAQDEWKLRPNLTLNLGVRYSFYNIFHEVHGKANPFDFATCGAAGFCGVGASFGNPNTLDVDPRISVAWSPSGSSPIFGGGKTVIRSGFGIYHGDGQLDDQNVPIKNEVGAYSLSAKSTPGLSFPITPFLNGPGTISANADYRNRKDMYVSQWGLSVQRALPHDLIGTLSYVGSKGTFELITSYVNLIDPATGVRPYPAFGQVRWRGNSNSSSYDGFVASLQRSFTHGLLVSANYTYSHQIDQDAPGGGDSDNPQDPACMACERASGDFDARHVVNANVVYDLPFGPGKPFLSEPGIVSAVFGRWSLTDIVAARSGTPLNVTYSRSSSSIATGYTTNQRPNLVPGVSLTPPGGESISGTTENWINPAAFTTVPGSGYGDAPRNIARGPNLWQTDLGVSKRIPITERTQLQFRCETFNLFNRAQYSLPLEEIWLPPTGTASSSIEPQVSTASTTPIGTGTPREIQFALRLEF